jgi:hypothetical protein
MKDISKDILSEFFPALQKCLKEAYITGQIPGTGWFHGVGVTKMYLLRPFPADW